MSTSRNWLWMPNKFLTVKIMSVKELTSSNIGEGLQAVPVRKYSCATTERNGW